METTSERTGKYWMYCVELGREVRGRAEGFQEEGLRNILEQVFEKCICFTHAHKKVMVETLQSKLKYLVST